MLLIGLDGTLQADTEERSPPLEKFPFPDLADLALEHPEAAVVAWKDESEVR